ncbi:MAG TPA: flagellar motor switch protein FliG [Methylomirabilota bacterium]|nr:flagellar motor switch protein FliG [Methylomirabilota bacterium]
MSSDSTTRVDSSKLTRIQKLAILLIMLGQESAAQVLRNLEEAEIEAVTAEMAKQTLIPMGLQQEILEEFTEVAIMASTSLRGGVEFAQTALEKAVGMFKANTVISRVAPSRAPVPAMRGLLDLEPRQLLNIVKSEQPQTIALLVSYLPPEKGSGLLTLLREGLREEVVERLATLGATPIEVVERVVAGLCERVSVKPTRAVNQTGGVKSAADLLNAVNKDLTKSILKNLDESNPDLSAAIRQKMFTFEDLAQLDVTSLQKVMREVDMRDLALSLKTASERLKEALLSAVSKRAAETVHEEMSFLTSVKLKDIEGAQMRILEGVRKLEAEGELDLSSLHETADAIAA